MSKTCQISTIYLMENNTKKNYNIKSKYYGSFFSAISKYVGGNNVIVEFNKEDKNLIFRLTEDIDQHTVEKVRRKMDNEIKGYIPRKVVFDFSNISFMDSAGIGMVLGRYKLAKMLNGNLEIINVNKSMKKIFDMSGVSRIIDIKEEDKNEGVI